MSINTSAAMPDRRVGMISCRVMTTGKAETAGARSAISVMTAGKARSR
jgi:hypothetical protein